MESVHQKAFAKFLASMCQADSQAAQERRRHGRVSWKPLAHVLRESLELHRGCRERVEPGDACGIVSRNKNVGDRRPSVQVLASLLLEVDVEGGNTAVECVAVMCRLQRFDDELS
jgi:hypothetical protein